MPGPTVSLAQQIYALNNELDWPRSHIVRADVVDGDGMPGVNIVAPVWAPTLDGVRDIANKIGNVPGVTQAQFVVVRVDGKRPLHEPFPPHKAQGFVTGEEANPSARPMGFNGWG
jgi:hypothetical protein